jgi:hypothetical protein
MQPRIFLPRALCVGLPHTVSAQEAAQATVRILGETAAMSCWRTKAAMDGFAEETGISGH